MAAAAGRAAAGKTTKTRRAAATDDIATAKVSPAAQGFLDLFYAVHYRVGIGIEDSLRGGRLSRHQVAILWLIRSEGAAGRSISRKAIERSITRWYELGSSAISKTIRGMAKAPLSLIEIREHPLSGREREVFLTKRGLQEIERMVVQGQNFIQTMVDHLSAEEASQGVHFLSRVSDIIRLVEPQLRNERSARAST